MSEKVEKRSRTPHLDAALKERYHKNPGDFKRRTFANLSVGIFLLLVSGALAYFAARIVGLSAGGDGVLLMTLTFLLVAVIIFDDVKWRLALSGKSISSYPQ